jgi:hypothetical protein
MGGDRLEVGGAITLFNEEPWSYSASSVSTLEENIAAGCALPRAGRG